MNIRLLILPMALAAAACSGRYMGLDTAALDTSTRASVERARIGDKQAQYQLGLQFARGDGLPQDCGKARKLFRQAASKLGRTIWVYSPPVTKGGSGRVIPIDSGPVRAGLPAVKMALEIEGLCSPSCKI